MLLMSGGGWTRRRRLGYGFLSAYPRRPCSFHGLWGLLKRRIYTVTGIWRLLRCGDLVVVHSFRVGRYRLYGCMPCASYVSFMGPLRRDTDSVCTVCKGVIEEGKCLLAVATTGVSYSESFRSFSSSYDQCSNESKLQLCLRSPMLY